MKKIELKRRPYTSRPPEFFTVDDADYPRVIRYQWVRAGSYVEREFRKQLGLMRLSHYIMRVPHKAGLIKVFHLNGDNRDFRRKNLKVKRNPPDSWRDVPLEKFLYNNSIKEPA